MFAVIFGGFQLFMSQVGNLSTDSDIVHATLLKLASAHFPAQTFVAYLLVQLPNLDSAVWASAIGAMCSFGYSFLCLGMSIWQLATYGVEPTSVGGYPTSLISPAQKTWDVFNAFGGIVFAFSFSFILIESEFAHLRAAAACPATCLPCL